jgi:hypothetical protein
MDIIIKNCFFKTGRDPAVILQFLEVNVTDRETCAASLASLEFNDDILFIQIIEINNSFNIVYWIFY